MKQLLQKQGKVISFLMWTLWLPVILFCAHLLISARNGSIYSFVYLSIALFLILLLIGGISKCIENKLQGVYNFKSRICKQYLYGFITPLCSFMISATIYDEFIGDYIIQRLHLLKEMSIIVMFLYVANSFYLVVKIDHQFLMATISVKEEIYYHDKVVVYHKGAYGPVNLMEIALINQRNQINWLITFNEEHHILDLSLKEIEDILNPKHFFKINRNQIIHKNAVDKFRSGTHGKIELELKVNGIKTTVSKDRAKDFRKWVYK